MKPWLGSDGVGDRNGFFLITMGSFARDGVVGLGPLPVPPERLALPAHGNWGSFAIAAWPKVCSLSGQSKSLRETIS